MVSQTDTNIRPRIAVDAELNIERKGPNNSSPQQRLQGRSKNEHAVGPSRHRVTTYPTNKRPRRHVSSMENEMPHTSVCLHFFFFASSLVTESSFRI